jgi:ketosteroid isomerase-like protein
MSDLDDFLTPTLARQLEAKQALSNGDPGPRLAMWSTQDPVTVFGAMRSDIGSEEVRQVFRWLATRFSNCTDYSFELVAAGASGDLAYTLGYEHVSFSMDGGPVAPLTLRVTHYRREDGEWKIVHRHADAPRPVSSLPLTHRRSRHFTARVRAALGPHRGHIPPERQGQQWSRAVGQHSSPATPFNQHHSSWDHPGSLAHGGSQKFKLPAMDGEAQ